MMTPRSALVLALVFLALPALAATRLPVSKPDATAADNALDLMHKAAAANAKGDKDLAFRLAQAAIVADPARPQTYDLLADLYAGEGQNDFASFYYNEALGIDPTDAAARKGAAEVDHDSDQRAAEVATPAK